MNIQSELPPLRSLPSGHDQTMRAALMSELMSPSFSVNTRQPLRRRFLTPAFAGIVTVPILIAAVLVGTWQTTHWAPGRSATPAPISSQGTSATPAPISSQGMSADRAFSASCAESYGLATLKKRAFAFDGTVSRITTMQPPADGSGALDGYVTVTFTVNEWFRGGEQGTLTLDMGGSMGGSLVVEDQELSYGVGTRLLVSGEPRFGGSPLKAAVAWGCGFTRYYDKGTAASWHQAFSQNG